MLISPVRLRRRLISKAEWLARAQECCELALGLHAPGAATELLEYAQHLEREVSGADERAAPRQAQRMIAKSTDSVT
ncbi:MAG: hypothetical protein ACLQJR_30105 [Stellaceae bacterium]